MTPQNSTSFLRDKRARVHGRGRVLGARVAAAALTLGCLAWTSIADAYPLKFPARANSMPNNDTFFRTSGHIGGYSTGTWAIDVGAYYYDGSQWQPYANDPPSNSDAYVWGAEVYAPEDGEVVACWRTAPDKSAPGQDYDFDGDGSPDTSPMAGGNHIQLRNAAGDHIIYFAHLQDDSIPLGVCPLMTTDDWPSNNSASCDIPGSSGYRASTVLPAPVPIQAGQFLGRVGNSGASSGPHLHIHVKEYELDDAGNHCEGDSEEIEFFEGWSQPRSPGVALTSQGWDALDEDNPLPGEHCFWPDPVGPRTDTLAVDDASDINMVTDHDGAVVAYRNDQGNLTLTDFDVEPGTGHVDPVGTIEEGGVLDVALASPYHTAGRDVIAAVKTNSGKLKLIAYDEMVRQPSSSDYTSGGNIGFVELARAPTHDGVVAAIQTNAGDLKLIDFEVHRFSDMDIDRDGSVNVGEHVDEVAIDTIFDADGFSGVVTADRNGNTLTLRTFEVDYSGSYGSVTTAGSIVAPGSYSGEVDVRWMDSNTIVTAARTLAGNLRVDTWTVDSIGDLSHAEVEWAGSVGAIGLGADWAADAVTAVENGDGSLSIISWQVQDDGAALRRTGTRGAGQTDEVELGRWYDWETPADSEYMVVALRSGDTGELNMLTYETNFDDG